MRPGPAPLLVAALLAACGGPEPAGPGRAPAPAPARSLGVLRTLVPVGAPQASLDPAARWPAGSRIEYRAAGRPDAAPRVLSAGLDAAGAPWVHPDGRQVLFVGRERPGAPYGIWRTSLDGGPPERLVRRAGDCGRAALLPDGRLVFSAALEAPGGPLGTAHPYALFVAKTDGSEAERITYGGGLDLDPCLLRDGRVLYAGWLPPAPGRPAGGQLALLTVHTDGTGVTLFHGDGTGPRLALLPHVAPDGAFGYLGGTQLASVSSWRVDGRAPLEPPQAAPAAGGAAPAGLRVAETLPVVPRPMPQGHLSMVKRKQRVGRLLCVDARLGEGGGGQRVRIRSGTGGVLGEVPLEADGSFFATVPADRPLTLELLDAEGAVLRRTVTPFWVRPNENRGCVGCHVPRDTAPPNVRPRAVTHRPVRLPPRTPRRGGGS